MLLNVIFPALSTAYLFSLFLPFLAIWTLASEVAAFWALERQSRSGRLVAAVVGANVFSWLGGVLITSSPIVPSGLVPQLSSSGVETLTQGPEWGTLANLSWFFAFGLSSVLEYAVLRAFSGRLALSRPATAVLVANAASYGGIGLVLLVLGGV